jgi:hypothetical protein
MFTLGQAAKHCGVAKGAMSKARLGLVLVIVAAANIITVLATLFVAVKVSELPMYEGAVSVRGSVFVHNGQSHPGDPGVPLKVEVRNWPSKLE